MLRISHIQKVFYCNADGEFSFLKANVIPNHGQANTSNFTTHRFAYTRNNHRIAYLKWIYKDMSISCYYYNM